MLGWRFVEHAESLPELLLPLLACPHSEQVRVCACVGVHGWTDAAETQGKDDGSPFHRHSVDNNVQVRTSAALCMASTFDCLVLAARRGP